MASKHQKTFFSKTLSRNGVPDAIVVVLVVVGAVVVFVEVVVIVLICTYRSRILYFKGTVQLDFRPPVFFIIQTSLGHGSMGLNIFVFSKISRRY